jgi:hypothetical protein
MLVPAVDSDGNEIAGIRLPDVAVPAATFTGWNLRSESVGAAGALGRWNGSYFPFALTAEERKQSGDPRLSVAERYPTRYAYWPASPRRRSACETKGFCSMKTSSPFSKPPRLEITGRQRALGNDPAIARLAPTRRGSSQALIPVESSEVQTDSQRGEIVAQS